MTNGRYQFADFIIDSTRASLTCAGAAVALRPKSFALLEYLVAHAGRLVGKDELLAAVWAGVVVTDDSLTRCISDVRAALHDSGQDIIKTVSRRGYLFAAAVVALDGAGVAQAGARLPDEAAAAAVPPLPVRRQRWPLLQVLLVVLVLLAAAAAAAAGLLAWRGSPPAAPRLSLIVLPFATVGDDAAQAALADALTDNLTGAAARLHGVQVVSAGSALAFKGRQADVRQVGRDFNVRFALEGSVLRGPGGGLRINARLIDARTAASLWSDQFDLDRSQLATAPDSAVLRLAGALEAELLQAHSRRTAGADPQTLDAEDLAIQCSAAARTSDVDARGLPGSALCRQALDQDPRNVRALARLAWLHADRVSRGQTDDAAADLALASGYAARALRADVGHAAAHCAQAAVLEGQHRVPDAIAAAQRCQALNPSDAGADRMLMIEHFFLAQPQQTLEHAERAMQLSPRDPRLPVALLFKGWALLQMGRRDDAVAWLRQAHAAAPQSPNIVLAMSVALVLAGHEAEARDAMAAYLRLPRTRARTVAQWDHRPDGNAAFAAFADTVNVALRRAGMPP